MSEICDLMPYFEDTNMNLTCKGLYKTSFTYKLIYGKIKNINFLIPPGGFPEAFIIKNKFEYVIVQKKYLKKAIDELTERFGRFSIHPYTPLMMEWITHRKLLNGVRGTI